MTTEKSLTIFFDGLCEPQNPGGVACCGWVIKGAAGVIAEGADFICQGPGATNNVAEYSGLGKALAFLVDNGWHGETLAIFGDSKLVIEQVSGNWKINKPHLQKLVDRVRQLLEAEHRG